MIENGNGITCEIKNLKKKQFVVLKLVKLYCFESIGLSPTITIQHDHIYKIFENMFYRINYRKNIVEMILLQKYKVFY